MSLHIIIDGYNMIRQSPALSTIERQDLQLGREALVDSVAEYKRIKKHKITIVFDGTRAHLLSNRHDTIKGIMIKFSNPGETADTEIKRIAAQEREKALVVTSDRDIVRFVSARGAATMSSDAFEEKIWMTSYMMSKGITSEEGEEAGGWTPTTRKKGPHRRLSKTERRNRIKIRKL